MRDAINEVGGFLAVFVLAPFLVYVALGFASALFSWASAPTTPLWHRYILCMGMTAFLMGVQRYAP